MQFAYQDISSTAMCRWTVINDVEHFLSMDTTAFEVIIDMSKALGMVEWGPLFEDLLSREVDCLLLLFIYNASIK